MPNATKTAGPNLSPTGTQQNQPGKKGYRKQGRPAKRWEDDLNAYQQPTRSNRDNNDLTSDTTWLTTASMESDFVSKQTRANNTTHDTYHHDYDKPTNNARPKQQVRLRLTTKTKTTVKTTTIRYSSSLNESTVEPPQHQKQPHQAHSIKKKEQPGFLMTHSS